VLEATRTYRDPSGRVIIEERDDRDTSFAITTPQPGDVRGLSAFSEIIRIPLERARRGHLVLSALIATTAAFTNQFLAIEVNVVGYVGSSGTVVAATALDNNFNLVEFSWDQPSTYAAIGIEAREIIDGQPSGSSTGIGTLTVSLAGTYWR
jgi:hypothetical protein